GQFVHAAHDQLPFFAMWLNTIAKQLMGNQVCDLMRHGLAQEVFAVLAVQLRVETQQVFVQMRNASLLAAQLEADHRTFERTFEKFFGLLITDFDTGIELLGHAFSISREAKYAAKPGRAENPSCRMVMDRRIVLLECANFVGASLLAKRPDTAPRQQVG